MNMYVSNLSFHTAEDDLRKLFEKFPNLAMDTYVIMPNHIHGIIQIVGAIPCNRPNGDDRSNSQEQETAISMGENMVSPLPIPNS